MEQEDFWYAMSHDLDEDPLNVMLREYKAAIDEANGDYETAQKVYKKKLEALPSYILEPIIDLSREAIKK